MRRSWPDRQTPLPRAWRQQARQQWQARPERPGGLRPASTTRVPWVRDVGAPGRCTSMPRAARRSIVCNTTLASESEACGRKAGALESGQWPTWWRPAGRRHPHEFLPKKRDSRNALETPAHLSRLCAHRQQPANRLGSRTGLADDSGSSCKGLRLVQSLHRGCSACDLLLNRYDLGSVARKALAPGLSGWISPRSASASRPSASSARVRPPCSVPEGSGL